MPAQPDHWENYLLQLVNASRAEAGVAPLAFEPELQASAEMHSRWMLDADVFSHTGAGGSTPFQRMAAEGYGYRTAGENVAYTAGVGASVVDAADVERLHANLMASPGHMANLLNPNYTEVGLGLEQGDFRGRPAIMLTENFGLPTVAEAAEPDVWFI